MANSNLSKIKAIVFDLDDTLYPQIEYKRSGFKVVSAWVAERVKIDRSMVMVELEAILKQQGPSYPNIFDKLVERLNLSQALIDEMVRVFIDHDPRINCFEGVIPMLKRLSSRYRLGILTDGRLSVQRKKIRSLGLRPHVDEILCSDRLGKEKPSADLFEWFENRFRLNGVNLIYVGDNPIKDFYGANNRDWHTICVMTGEKKDVDLSNAYLSEFSISSVVELEKMLDG